MKWPSVILAMFGIITIAWTFPVRCLEKQRFLGSVRLSVTVIASKYIYMYVYSVYIMVWLCAVGLSSGPRLIFPRTCGLPLFHACTVWCL